MSNAGAEFTRLVEIMATLRSPEGCPWDREQTLQSLSQYVLEEAYEVVDAIERGDLAALARGGRRPHLRGRLPLADCLGPEGIHRRRRPADRLGQARAAPPARLPRRRPRARRRVEGTRAVGRRRALALGRAEGAGAGRDRARPPATLGGLPRSLPALLAPTRSAAAPPPSASTGRRRRTWSGRSRRRSRSCARPSTEEPDNRERAEEEMGDLLFAIANLSRKLGIEPEAALQKGERQVHGALHAHGDSGSTRSGRTDDRT